jgi:glutathione S-transferase
MNKQMTETVKQFKAKLSSDPRWVQRALVVLLERQTLDEQRAKDTKYLNHQGFTAADAALLTSFAQQVNAGRNLSEKQLKWAYSKMPKYAKQLAEIAQAKQAA